MTAIEATGLTKIFDEEQVALSNLSFYVEKGKVLGLLGPNGAGKTTTIRILNGILEPSSGEAFILGLSIKEHAKKIRQFCGVMTETAAPYESLTPRENLLFFGQIHTILKAQLDNRINWLLNYFDLKDSENKKVKYFSAGMKKKLSLCIALLHQPSVLFLDEPTASLDPEASRDVNRLIRQMAEEQKITVLLCTHQLKYADEICTLFAFIDKGKLTGFGTYNELLKKKDKSIYLEIRGKNLPFSLGFSLENGLYKRVVKDDIEAASLIAEIIKNNGNVYEARQKKPTLEDLYFMYLENKTTNYV